MPIVTAAEAAQEVSAFNRQMNGADRRLPPTLGRILQLQKDEVFSICNVGPWDYRIERGSLMVYIPAYDAVKDSAGLGYSASDPMPEVRREAKIVDEFEYSYFEDDGRMVARDLIGEGFGLPKKNSLAQFGVFVPNGRKPSKEELAAARLRLSECIDRLIAEARDAYDQGPQQRADVICDRHIWAARQRGIDEAWVHHQHTQQSVRCEMCGQYNPSGIAKCRCGNIVDPKLYREIMAKQKAIEEEIELEAATKPRK